MLAPLKIENVAVIEKAEVRFTPGLNVLTGETGAGKSILIDSINAILGNRTSRELVRSGAQKAAIWATFEQIPDSVHKPVSYTHLAPKRSKESPEKSLPLSATVLLPAVWSMRA